MILIPQYLVQINTNRYLGLIIIINRGLQTNISYSIPTSNNSVAVLDTVLAELQNYIQY